MTPIGAPNIPPPCIKAKGQTARGYLGAVRATGRREVEDPPSSPPPPPSNPPNPDLPRSPTRALSRAQARPHALNSHGGYVVSRNIVRSVADQQARLSHRPARRTRRHAQVTADSE